MKRIIIIFLLLSFGVCSSQTYVKVADKIEYTKYLDYCNTPVSKLFDLWGKVSLLQVNGSYFEPDGRWRATSNPPSVTWFKIGTDPVTAILKPNEQFVHLEFTCKVQKRKPSIADFYANWITKKIQYGMVSN